MFSSLNDEIRKQEAVELAGMGCCAMLPPRTIAIEQRDDGCRFRTRARSGAVNPQMRRTS
jgi:hypothetical protein